MKFERATIPPEEVERVVRETVEAFDADPRSVIPDGPLPSREQFMKDARKAAERGFKGEVYLNDKYQVIVQRNDGPEGWPDIIHLSIKRRDKDVIHDWRELQEIKNAIVGPENEAVELYPAESRLVDSANQFHLWCLSEPGHLFPFGMFTKAVKDDGEIAGSRQRRREPSC